MLKVKKEMKITVDHNLEEIVKKKIVVDTKIEGKLGKINFNELKSGGFIKQRQKDLFTVRMRCPGGRIPVKNLKKIAEVAERFGGEYVHLSFRQSLEIPYVNYKNFNVIIEELKEVDQNIASCGPRVRVPTACSGCEYNPNGLVDTQKMAYMVNEKFFGQGCNHKFKISFSGCPIDCARTNEMDLGFQGAVFPVWDEDPCTGCTICASACLEGAITPHPETGKPIFNLSKCLFCSDCIRACPSGAWRLGKVGYVVRIGGRHGRHPHNGGVIAKFISDEDVPKVIKCVLEWYKENGEGRGRIRIGEILKEAGKMESLVKRLEGILGDKVIKNPSLPQPIPINKFD
ncbi:MAG: 4Fe-4S dicluster domain-containing protein [Nitrospinota bacterium]|jgi:dissimilatory sulfite reductase (desulfoviridin) alpha/beta subunit